MSERSDATVPPSVGGEFLKLPLTEKMRLSAIVLEMVEQQYGGATDLWSSADLLGLAEQWDEEAKRTHCECGLPDNHASDCIDNDSTEGADHA